jgi:putative Mg2+ transporter-C (MgtC) family protein
MMTSIQPLELVGRLLLAACLGGLIGLEREARQKAAGLRTNTLIALGSALFTLLSFATAWGTPTDPSRVAAGIVTGVGFLGGGVILRTRGHVQGMTTAATIWVNSAIGMAAAVGSYRLAVATTVITLAVLRVLGIVERRIERRNPEGGGKDSAAK